MSKEGRCKNCLRGRCNMCRGYRNGNKALRCLCTHTKEKPAPTPAKFKPAGPALISPGELDIARLLVLQGLPDRVSYG